MSVHMCAGGDDRRRVHGGGRVSRADTEPREPDSHDGARPAPPERQVQAAASAQDAAAAQDRPSYG